jgi:hypothetical protein
MTRHTIAATNATDIIFLCTEGYAITACLQIQHCVLPNRRTLACSFETLASTLCNTHTI